MNTFLWSPGVHINEVSFMKYWMRLALRAQVSGGMLGQLLSIIITDELKYFQPEGMLIYSSLVTRHMYLTCCMHVRLLLNAEVE